MFACTFGGGKMCRFALVGACAVLAFVGCSSDGGGTQAADAGVANDTGSSADAAKSDGATRGPRWLTRCPGGPGCASNTGPLLAGAAAVTISPTAYEIGRVSYMEIEGSCPEPTPQAPLGLWRCGSLVDEARHARADCGLDGICSGDFVKTRTNCDAQGGCPAGLTCNKSNNRCYISYDKPDPDGSEGDGLPDWFLDCGRDRVCPCLDGAGHPAYYGKDSKCLVGHTANNAYTGPDADGSEGNGQYDGLWMAGFGNNHPFLGRHDDSWARTVVLQSGDTTVAIISLDVVGFFYPDVQKLRDKVRARVGAGAVDYVLVSSTHNHEGPDVMGQWGPAKGGLPTESGVNPEYLGYLLDRAAESVDLAIKDLRQVTLQVGTVKTGVDGYVRDSRDPKIVMDELTTIQLRDATNATPVATVVNWGNHPEVLSDKNNYLTSDFPHYVREGIEKAIPAAGGKPELPAIEGVAVYLQGAVGCLMTPLGVTVTDRAGVEHSASDWNKAEALGVNLAVKAREALDAAEVVASPTVSLTAMEVRFPVKNLFFQVAFNQKLLVRDVYDYDASKAPSKTNIPKIASELVMIEVGDLTLVSIPGEIAPELLVGGYDGSRSGSGAIISTNNEHPPDLKRAPAGPYLLDKLPGKHKVPVGLANDEVGYIVPNWNFVLSSFPYLSEADGDHYEETNSLGPDTEPLLLKAYDQLIKRAATK